MSNDTSVFPVALLENAVTGPIRYQGEEVRSSPTHANNSADAIVREAVIVHVGFSTDRFAHVRVDVLHLQQRSLGSANARTVEHQESADWALMSRCSTGIPSSLANHLGSVGYVRAANPPVGK